MKTAPVRPNGRTFCFFKARQNKVPNFTGRSLVLFGTTPLRGAFPRSFTRFPANFLNMSRIFPNFTMKLCISAMIAINGLVATNLLNISDMCNFFHYKCFKKLIQPTSYQKSHCKKIVWESAARLRILKIAVRGVVGRFFLANGWRFKIFLYLCSLIWRRRFTEHCNQLRGSAHCITGIIAITQYEVTERET